MIRWAVIGIIAGLTVVLALVILGWPRQNSPDQDQFLKWETCTLNNQQHCGPMPQP